MYMFYLVKKIVNSIKEECIRREEAGLEPNQMYIIWDEIQSGEMDRRIREEDRY